MASKNTPTASVPMINVRLTKEQAIVHNPSSGKRLRYYKGEPVDGMERERDVTSVPDAPYWRRRIRDGHVELVDEPQIDHNGGNPQLDGEPVNPSRVGPPKAGPAAPEQTPGAVTTTTKKNTGSGEKVSG